MSDEELYKAIKEYSEKNDLSNRREANKILRRIMDTCRSHEYCIFCPYSRDDKGCIFIFNSRAPEKWEI